MDLPARDRLPKWRYGRYPASPEWERLDRGGRIHWQEEADTVITAIVKLSIYKIIVERRESE
jgi:hypothetical protein